MTLLVACIPPSWSYHHHHHHQPHCCRHQAWDAIRQDTKPLVKWIALLKTAGFELLMDPWSTNQESHDSFIGWVTKGWSIEWCKIGNVKNPSNILKRGYVTLFLTFWWPLNIPYSNQPHSPWPIKCAAGEYTSPSTKKQRIKFLWTTHPKTIIP